MTRIKPALNYKRCSYDSRLLSRDAYLITSGVGEIIETIAESKARISEIDSNEFSFAWHWTNGEDMLKTVLGEDPLSRLTPGRIVPEWKDPWSLMTYITPILSGILEVPVKRYVHTIRVLWAMIASSTAFNLYKKAPNGDSAYIRRAANQL